MQLFLTFLIAYVSTVISDYIVHRNIMHGKWAVVRGGGRLFQFWLYPHFVQHIVAHHSHSVHAKSELAQGLPVPKTLKLVKEKQFENSVWPRLALACSDHGISIKDGACLFSFLSLFLITPQYLVAGVLATVWGAWYGAIVVLFTLIPAFNHFHHRFYHMDRPAKEKLAPSFLRHILLTREIEKISLEHMQHHHSREYSDDYYNLLPFGRYILRPLFGKH